MTRPSQGLVPGFVPGLLAAVLTAAAACATAASAADLPPAPAYYPPAYHPAIYDWSGVYFGGHIGAGMLQDSVTATTTTTLQTAGTVSNITPFGLIAGGQFGANYEIAPWVIGAEGTWSSSGVTGSKTLSTLVANTYEHETSAPYWYATATGRLGYAANTLLFYAKGGAAWMRVDYTQNVPSTGGVSIQDISDVRTGIIVGAGLEYGMTENLSAKIDYDFLDFGTKTYNFNSLTAAAGSLPLGINSDTHIFTVGLNYRFNWVGGGALAAKY